MTLVGLGLLYYHALGSSSLSLPALHQPVSNEGIGISSRIAFQMEWIHYVMTVLYLVMLLDIRPELFSKVLGMSWVCESMITDFLLLSSFFLLYWAFPLYT
jgi:hypothetical protein